MARPAEMTPEDLRASVIAMLVRNAIEDIHANPTVGLTDDVMVEMNLLIRRAIWRASRSSTTHHCMRSHSLGRFR